MYTLQRALAALIVAACAAGAVHAAQPRADVGLASSSAAAQPAGRAAQEALTQLGASLAAQAGSLPAGFPLAVGDVQDLQRARIGYGYEEFQADPQALLASASLQASARATGQWRYTISVDGRAVGLITMAQIEGHWQAVSLGGVALSAEVNNVARLQGGRGASLRFIRVLQASSDFIEATGSDKSVRYAPLEGARAALGLDAALRAPSDGLLDEADFSPALREAVSRNLAND